VLSDNLFLYELWPERKKLEYDLKHMASDHSTRAALPCPKPGTPSRTVAPASSLPALQAPTKK
jgi:hypothetical protein